MSEAVRCESPFDKGVEEVGLLGIVQMSSREKLLGKPDDLFSYIGNDLFSRNAESFTIEI